MRKLLAPAVVLGLLVGAMGVAGAATDSAPGVTKDEIKFGVTYVDFEPIRSVTNISHGDYEKSYNAVIDDLNKRGGVGGRKLVPTFAKINPLGTAPAQEACLKLTEDEHMFAVMGFFLNDAALCYAEQHDTPVLGGTITADLLARTKALWTTLESGADVAPRVIDTLTKAGAFKGGKVGLVTLAADENLLNDVVMPALKRNGVKVTTSAIIDAPANDVTAGITQAGTIMERFKSDGIKTVLAVNNSPSAVITALGKTDYRPRIAATAVNPFQAAAINPSTDPSVIKNSISADIGVDFKDPSLQKCFKLVEKATGDKILEYPAVGAPDFRASAATGVPVHPVAGRARGCRRQEPHGGGVQQGGREARIGPDPGLGHDHVRPQDPHVPAADVHLQVRPDSQVPGDRQEGRLSRRRPG